MKIVAGVAIGMLVLLAGCRASDEGRNASPQGPAAAIAPILTTPDAIDTHSFARPLEARVIHLALDLTVDFDPSRIAGTARLDIDRKPHAKEIVLDDNGLEID